MIKIKKIFILYLLVLWCAMGNAGQGNVTNTTSSANVNGDGQNSIFTLGELGPHGGKVFYVDASGKHGLEALMADEINTLNWHDAVLAVTQHGPGWRLPTITELELLYSQRNIIGGFAKDDYWSSTEQDLNSAWIQGFFLGDQDRYNKYSSLRVRAINEF